MDPRHTCCFTGHRPDKLPCLKDPHCSAARDLRRKVAQAILSLYENDGVDTFISGMALGVDLMAAREVLAFCKMGYPFRLVAALPFRGQARSWSAAHQAEYEDLLSRAHHTEVVCDTPSKYAYLMRNDWMTAHASHLIAVWDGSGGGTAYTVSSAQKRGLTLHLIRP